MKLKIVNFFLIIVSIYITLVACDWILKKIKYKNLNEASKIKLKTYKDSRLKKREAFESGYKFTIYPKIVEDSLELLDLEMDMPPLSSFINSRSFLCDEGYGLVKYKTDKFGFRNKNEIYENSLDIILVGDSFAHGACVEDEHSIGNILNRNFNVLNLSIGSTNPTHYALNLDIFIKYFKPKNVVIIFYSNDYEFNENSIYESLLKKDVEYFDKNSFINNRPTKYNEKVNNSLKTIEKEYALKIQSQLDKIVTTTHEKTFFSAKLNTLYYHLKLLEIKKHLLIISKKYSPETLPNNTLKMISLLKEKCNIETKCQPLAVLISSSDYWDYDYRGKIYLKNLRYNLIENEINFIDFSNKSNDRSFYAPKGIHLSIEGYSIISKKILQQIMKL